MVREGCEKEKKRGRLRGSGGAETKAEEKGRAGAVEKTKDCLWLKKGRQGEVPEDHRESRKKKGIHVRIKARGKLGKK